MTVSRFSSCGMWQTLPHCFFSSEDFLGFLIAGLKFTAGVVTCLPSISAHIYRDREGFLLFQRENGFDNYFLK